MAYRKLLTVLLAAQLLAGLAWAADKVNKTIQLPEPKIIGKMSIEESIFRRRSQRSFLPNQLTLDQLSQLLWAAQGITDKTWGFRAAPSSGSLYPLTIYVVKSDGVFRYVPDGHKLVQTSAEDIRPSLVRASLGHVAENIQLEAVSLGLVSVPVGAFWDDVVGKTLNLPDTQDPFYIIPVGYYNASVADEK